MIHLIVLERALGQQYRFISGYILTAMLMMAPAAMAATPIVPAVPHKMANDLVQTSEYVPLSRASQSLQAGKNAEALTDLTQTLEKNPINVLGLFQMGCAYLELAKKSNIPAERVVYLEQSKQAFERIVDLNSDLTLVYFKLGKIALMENDIAAAKQYYRSGMETDPKNAALIFNLGRVYDQNGEREEAIRYYQQTLSVDPGFTYAYNNLALLYEELKDYKSAEKIYKQALKRDKQYNLARLNLGNLYATMGNYVEAEQILNEAQAIEPNNEWVYYYQGNLYLRMSDYHQAVDAYSKALERNSQRSTTYYLLAVSLSKLNRMNEALQASLHYMQLAPNGEYAKEMKTLIMAVQLSQSNGLYFTKSPDTVPLVPQTK